MNSKQKLIKSKSFALFYGSGEVEKLNFFDVVIVEPSCQTSEGIRHLQDNGKLVIAYISIIEQPPGSPLLKLFKEEDFLHLEGKRAWNEEYGNYLMDITSTRYLNTLIHQTGKLLMNEGYDGVFIDTVGNIETQCAYDVHMKEMIQAYTYFLKELRILFKDAIIIQNNGLEKILPFVTELIDAICWENPPFGEKECELWLKEISIRLGNVWKDYSTKIMLLLEANEEELYAAGKGLPGTRIKLAQNMASEMGFLLYVAPRLYSKSVNII